VLEVSKIILLISITASHSGVVGLVPASLKLLLLPSPARSPRMTKQRANQRIQRRLKAKENLHLLLRPRRAMWSQSRKIRRRHQNQQPRGNQSVQASRRQVSPSPVRRGSDESGCRIKGLRNLQWKAKRNGGIGGCGGRRLVGLDIVWALEV